VREESVKSFARGCCKGQGKKKKIGAQTVGFVVVGAHPLCGVSSQRWLNPIKLYNPSLPNWPCPLTTNVFKTLNDRVSASGPGNRAYCCAELAVSFLSVAVTICQYSFYFASKRRDGQAELTWVVCGMPANSS